MRIDSAIITGSLIINGDTFGDLGAYTTTGSNTFVGNQSIVGAVSASALTGSISYTNLTDVPTLISGSEQIVDILSPLNSFTSSAIARLNSIETITSSNIARINALETTSASVDTLNTTQNTRLTNLEIKTGSLATTGSNTFIGTQTITGSLYISSDLVVQGSSSLQNITASAVSIGTNIINLNTANPAIRYAGLVIGDSGSIGSSGSFLYDSVQDEFIFVHRGANTTVTSSVLLMGPQTYDSIGNETYLTTNRIPKGAGNEHLIDSNISDNGTLVTINSVTASFTGVVGIGTTNPGSKLTIRGTDSTSMLYLGISGSSSNGEAVGITFGSATYDKARIVAYNENAGNAAGYLTFWTGGTPTTTDVTEKVRITSGGNVGIGSTNPGALLDAYINGVYSSGTTLKVYRGQDNNSTTGKAIDVTITNTGSPDNVTMYGLYIDSYVGSGNSNKAYSIYTNRGNVIFGATSGNIGIGTTNPQAKLSLVGGSTLRFGNDGDSGNSLIYLRGGTTGDKGIITLNHYGYADYTISAGGTANGVLSITKTSGGADGININSSGNVGINTTSPNVKLEVLDTATTSGEIARFQRNTDAINEYSYIRVGNGSYPAFFGSMLGTYDVAYMSMTENPTEGKGIYVRTTDGNVGIGVTNPSKKLTVAGRMSTTAIVSGNLIAGNIYSNISTSPSYILITDLNEVAGFSMSGKVNAASYTCWNISDIWIEKDYSSTTARAGIVGSYKSGCDFSIVDISYGAGRYVALRFTSNPEIDVMFTGYRLADLYQSDGTATVVTSGVTVNGTYASY
jgi:hypothetical protein